MSSNMQSPGSSMVPPVTGPHPPSTQEPAGVTAHVLATQPASDPEKRRFEVELEFVQMLGNPNYLLFLAQRGYMKAPEFINYLKYLQYWQTPQFSRYLRWPQCLHMLDLLQEEEFRKACSDPAACKFIDDQLLLHWTHYMRKRDRQFGALVERVQAMQQQSEAAANQQQQTAQQGAVASGNTCGPASR